MSELFGQTVTVKIKHKHFFNFSPSMAVSGGWNNFIELSLSIDEWITIEISQVNQGGKVRKTSSNILFILIGEVNRLNVDILNNLN